MKWTGAGGEGRKVSTWGASRAISAARAPSRSFGGNDSGGEGRGLREGGRTEGTTLFSRTDTHVLSRSPGSRDERALRAPLKATPDSKPRPSPATLAPGPLSLPRSLSSPSRILQLPTPHICSSLSLSFISGLLRLSLSESYLIYVWRSIFRPACLLHHHTPGATLSPRAFVRDAVVRVVHSISGNFGCPSVTRDIGRSPIFENITAGGLSCL